MILGNLFYLTLLGQWDRRTSSLTDPMTQEMQILEKGKHLLHQSPLIQLAWKQSAGLGGQEK